MSTASLAPIPGYNWKSIPVRESRKGIMQRGGAGQKRRVRRIDTVAPRRA